VEALSPKFPRGIFLGDFMKYEMSDFWIEKMSLEAMLADGALIFYYFKSYVALLIFMDGVVINVFYSLEDPFIGEFSR